MSEDGLERLQQGKRASIIGVAVNFLLFVIKIFIAVSVSSVALAADAVNNLCDAAGSIVSLIGFNIAAKPADDEHPFGHGRVEDITALIVAVIVTAVGLNFGKSAIEKIIAPVPVDINLIQTAFIGLTVLFKIGLFFYFRHVSRKIDSLSLRGAAFDSLSDIIGTVAVLASVGLGRIFDLQLDGYATLLVALIILKGGIDLVRDTVEPLIGGRPDADIVNNIRNILMEDPDIRGVHDVIVHSYGHNRYFATAHAELSEELSSIEAHDILEKAETSLSCRLPVTLVLHCDPFDTDNPETKEWRVRLENKLLQINDLFKLYDFKIEKTEGVLHFYFHLLTPRQYLMREHEIEAVLERFLAEYPEKTQLHINYVNSFV